MSEYLELLDLPSGYVSFSQINMYKRCPLQYRIRYVEGKKVPPPGSLVAGTSFHKAMETDLEQKITSGQNYKTSDVIEIFDDSFESTCKEVQDRTGELPNFKKEKKESVKDRTVLGLTEYHGKEAPKICPDKVEEHFEIEFSNTNYKLAGQIDVISKKKEIIDFKTTQRYSKSLIMSDQLKIYQIANPGIKLLRLDNVICTKEPRTEIEKFKPAPKEKIDQLLLQIDCIVKAIKAQIFYPLPGLNYMTCSYCGYKDKYCEFWR